MKWSHEYGQPAMHGHSLSSGLVECRLCPRHCQLASGEPGYCGVRGTVDGALHTFNYGLGLTPTEELIETEAVYHFSPGARILSLGNIGCMMSCVFCQNWETSQIRHLDPSHIRRYTPADIVNLCLDNDIKVLSWTYNDPVVWHEFVLETSVLARQQGVSVLYKSALYIEEAPLAELIDCVDIFSISLKSLRPAFYRQSTGAELAPILRRIEQIVQSDRHLELSYLVVTGLNDNMADIVRMIEWVSRHVGAHVPLHFVAFHPAYQYLDATATDPGVLLQARELALARGMRHVYLGNTTLNGINDTICSGCGAVLVRRYGLIGQADRLSADGSCAVCGTPSPVRNARSAKPPMRASEGDSDLPHRLVCHWHSQMQSVHVIDAGGTCGPDRIRVRSLGEHVVTERHFPARLGRFIVARRSDAEKGIVISWDSDNQYQVAPLLDRAHFPVSVDGFLAEQTDEE